MKQELDAYAHLDSLLHRWESRYKILGLFLLAFAFAFVEDVRLLPVLIIVTACLFWLSKLPINFLGGRLKIPGLILFGIVASLPFLSGTTVVASLGPIAIKQEGLLTAYPAIALAALFRGCEYLSQDWIFNKTFPSLSVPRSIPIVTGKHIASNLMRCRKRMPFLATMTYARSTSTPCWAATKNWRTCLAIPLAMATALMRWSMRTRHG